MTTTPIVLDKTLLTSLEDKKAKLESVRAALKTEFFGIDKCIDNIIESIKTWYLLPSVINRPPIVALWGMTGVGKTALVRSLVAHLGMTDVFLEVQMDGFSSANTYTQETISALLNGSGIQEGKPGIILLDEFQRFRTIDNKGEDISVKRFPDVWMLLSDGRFPSDYSKLANIIEYMDMVEYWDDEYAYNASEVEANRDPNAPAEPKKKEATYKRKFMMMRREAKDIKYMLRRPESIKEIMGWDKAKVRKLIEEAMAAKYNPPFDYSKCLIFVSGNLDEAYSMAGSVEDCDTSADVFYHHTLKIGTPEIKAALATRFRPEQIARLGNNHVIYPSLSQDAYMRLIRRTCLQYVSEVSGWGQVSFSIDDEVYKEIYENAVYPTQGTRPVFTSIHKMFGSPLSEGVFWAWERQIKSTITIGLDTTACELVFKSGSECKRVKIDLEIRARRKRYSDDFRALVAVHEAGHAIVYAALFKRAPWEVAINVASFKGGYNLFKEAFLCKQEMLDRIAVSYGGIAAEEAVFGSDLRSSGCGGDVSHATSYAAQYVRRYAMDGYNGAVIHDMSNLMLWDIEATDPAIEALLKDQRTRAATILTEHRELFIDLSNHLLKENKMSSAAFVAFVGNRLPSLAVTDSADKDVSNDYAARLARATGPTATLPVVVTPVIERAAISVGS